MGLQHREYPCEYSEYPCEYSTSTPVSTPAAASAVDVQHLLDAVTADQDYAEAWLALGLLQASGNRP